LTPGSVVHESISKLFVNRHGAFVEPWGA
jgi:hypothetical protein